MIDKYMCPLCEGNCDCFDAGRVGTDAEMQAIIKDLERKLKIAENALELYVETENYHVQAFRREIARDALKQIRGE